MQAVRDRRISIKRLALGVVVLLAVHGVAVVLPSNPLLFVISSAGVAIVVVSAALDASLTTGLIAVLGALVVHALAILAAMPMPFSPDLTKAVAFGDFVGGSILALFMYGLVAGRFDPVMSLVAGAATTPASLAVHSVSNSWHGIVLHHMAWLVLFSAALAVASHLRGSAAP